MSASDARYVVAVRALCDFTARHGDLDLRFTPAPSAQEGVAGHTLVQGRRGSGYQTEISLSGEWGPLKVRGRADGFDPQRKRLEEIKTYRGDLSRMRENQRHLHWAQLKVYGWLYCQQFGLTQIELALVYFDIGSARETVLTETCDAQTLKAGFEAQCAQFVAWAEQEVAHRSARDAALTALTFTHPQFRPGQRQLAEAVYKGALGQRQLLAQAPTGIGKTIGTLFPLLKAMPAQAIDKLFFLTAKTSGRAVLLHAAGKLMQAQNEDATGAPRKAHLPIRVLELTARDKACEHPDKACHGDDCPLAKGFYDRLPAARAAALTVPVLSQAVLRETALAHDICPYYLSQEMVRWSDVITGDYNYYFDYTAMLHGLTQSNQWRVGVLVDEAHNLLERARGMYSAELHPLSLKAAQRMAPASLKRSLSKVAREWKALAAAIAPQSAPDAPRAALFPEISNGFLPALQQLAVAVTDYLVDDPGGIDAALMRFYFDAMQFSRIADLFSEACFSDTIDTSEAMPLLSIRNIIPAPLLRPRFAGSHCTTLFSATLTPWQFYADTLGMAENCVWVDVESPFRAAQLSVRIVDAVSTRWQDRTRSLDALVSIMAQQYQARAGNYLAFFSSYDYLQQAASRLSERFPSIPLRLQAPRMLEADQAAFISAFTASSTGIGFAVLGGAFSEGVDLPGARLIGAFIATLGLPQWNPFNEEIKSRMAQQFGQRHAYDYAYLFPGLRKVVQAAGRVIRTPEDEGVVYLIDDRFTRADVRRLLPAWWQPERADQPATTGATLQIAPQVATQIEPQIRSRSEIDVDDPPATHFAIE